MVIYLPVHLWRLSMFDSGHRIAGNRGKRFLGTRPWQFKIPRSVMRPEVSLEIVIAGKVITLLTKWPYADNKSNPALSHVRYTILCTSRDFNLFALEVR